MSTDEKPAADSRQAERLADIELWIEQMAAICQQEGSQFARHMYGELGALSPVVRGLRRESADARLVAAEAALATANTVISEQSHLLADAIGDREDARAQLADANKRIEELEAGGQQ